MSNNTPYTFPEDDAPAWNISQLFYTIGAVSLAVGAVFACSKIEEKLKPKDTNSQKSFIKAFEDKSKHFGGLPIIRIGNPEEIHTLKSQGKEGWYIFQKGNTLTYWKIHSGIIESNTYTLTK